MRAAKESKEIIQSILRYIKMGYIVRENEDTLSILSSGNLDELLDVADFLGLIGRHSISL